MISWRCVRGVRVAEIENVIFVDWPGPRPGGSGTPSKGRASKAPDAKRRSNAAGTKRRKPIRSRATRSS